MHERRIVIAGIDEIIIIRRDVRGIRYRGCIVLMIVVVNGITIWIRGKVIIIISELMGVVRTIVCVVMINKMRGVLKVIRA